MDKHNRSYEAESGIRCDFWKICACNAFGYQLKKCDNLRQFYIFFAKLVWQRKSKEWAKFGLECLLLIFIYSNSKFKVAYIKLWTLNAVPSGLILKINHPKYLTLYLPICIFIRNSNWMASLGISLDKPITCASEWFILT